MACNVLKQSFITLLLWCFSLFFRSQNQQNLHKHAIFFFFTIHISRSISVILVRVNPTRWVYLIFELITKYTGDCIGHYYINASQMYKCASGQSALQIFTIVVSVQIERWWVKRLLVKCMLSKFYINARHCRNLSSHVAHSNDLIHFKDSWWPVMIE